MKTHQFSLCLFACGVLLTSVSGCHEGDSSAANAPSAADLERVTVGKPLRKTLTLKTTQPARIVAFEETPLFAKLAGFVKEIKVDIGDQVAEGQTLVSLDIPELLDDVSQKEAMVAQADAEVDQAESGVEAAKAASKTADAKVAEVQAGIHRANATYDRWNAEYNRIKSLSDKGTVTEKLKDETLHELHAAEAGRDEAAAAVQSAEAAALEARANVKKAEADKVAAEARRNVSKAELNRAQTMLSYAEIKAPFQGVVTRRSVDTGHFVQPAGGAGNPLLVIARTDKVRAVLDVPEMDAAMVDVGDEAHLLVQALHGKPLDAFVTRISWSINPSNRSLRAEIDVENDGSILRPGMYALGTIQLERRDGALVLPATAVVRDGSDAYCCCVQSGKVDRRKIELGLRSGPEMEIVGGIDEESDVVLSKADSLQQGQRVAVIHAPK